MAKKYTIAVDFDGVLHNYTPDGSWPECTGPPVEGSLAWLREIRRDFKVVVLSARARSDEGAAAISAWLTKRGVPGLEVTAVKPPALVYIDDRAYRFNGPGTLPDRHEIHRARPWNRPA